MSLAAQQLRGIVLALAGFTLWVVADSCIKLAANAALPPQQVIAVLGFVGAAAILAKNARRGGIRTLRPGNMRHQLLSAGLSLAINLLNVVALKHLPFIIFYIAVFTAPMVIALLAASILKEHLTPRKIIAVTAGFVGVVIATNPFDTGGDLHGDWIGYAAASGAVLCFSINMIVQRRLMRSENPDSLALTQTITQAVVCGTWTFFSHVPFPPLILLILCGGGIVNIMGNLCNITAIKYAPAATVAQFHYTQIISGAIIGFLLWHEVPTPYLVIGSIIIIASGLYIANRTRKGIFDPTVKSP